MFQDEARFGTMTTLTRAWAEKGKPFTVKTRQGRESFYAYSAVASTGESALSVKPNADSEAMSEFLFELAILFDGRPLLIFMDGAAWHRSKNLAIPGNIKISILPPYSPELNPVERLWKHVRKIAMHNKVFKTLEEVREAMHLALMSITTSDLARLCACGYI